MGIDAESPASDIGLMRALIAGVAVAVVALPMPVVVEFRARQFRIGVRRRAAPKIEVYLVRDLVIAEFTDRSAAFVAQRAR